jgi:hypothetical protein
MATLALESINDGSASHASFPAGSHENLGASRGSKPWWHFLSALTDLGYLSKRFHILGASRHTKQSDWAHIDPTG